MKKLCGIVFLTGIISFFSLNSGQAATIFFDDFQNPALIRDQVGPPPGWVAAYFAPENPATPPTSQQIHDGILFMHDNALTSHSQAVMFLNGVGLITQLSTVGYSGVSLDYFDFKSSEDWAYNQAAGR